MRTCIEVITLSAMTKLTKLQLKITLLDGLRNTIGTSACVTLRLAVTRNNPAMETDQLLERISVTDTLIAYCIMRGHQKVLTDVILVREPGISS